jgi:tetratricopeptide (TPR) repeat protein
LRGQKGLPGDVPLLEGLLAAEDGRPEQALAQLQLAQRDARYTLDLLPVIGLAKAYMGLGVYKEALAELQKIQEVVKKPKALTPEQEMAGGELLRDLVLDREMLHCYLALGQLDKAVEVKTRLENTPQGLAARILVVNYYLAVGRARAAQKEYLDAREALDAAKKELDAAAAINPNDPNVVWAKAVLALSDPRSPNTGGPTPEQKAATAEHVLKAYAAKKDFAGALLWTRWLESRGRRDDLRAALTQMRQDFPARKGDVDALEARLTVLHGEREQEAQLVEAVRAGKDDLSGDALQVLYLLTRDGSATESTKTLLAVLGRHQSHVLAQLWKGQVYQHAGQLAEAARAYARALAPSPYQFEAQFGLLTTLLALANKESPPREAFNLTNDLVLEGYSDPVLLVGYAEMARRMDRLLGRSGMQSALGSVEVQLTRARKDPAVAADLLARGWYAAGRPDLALKEALRAAQLNPEYGPPQALVALLYAEAEDWNQCLDQAERLAQLLPARAPAGHNAPSGPRSILDRTQPSPTDALYWKAVALVHLGRPDEAHRVYDTLTTKYPDLLLGYLGQAGLREKLKDYPGALEWVKRWRDHAPEDLHGLEAEVRLLALSGKLDGADKEAEHFLSNLHANPGQKQHVKDSPAQREWQVLYHVARAFASAKAFDRAEAWAGRALAAIGKLSASDNGLVRHDQVATHLLLGRIAEQRGQPQKAIDEYQAVRKLDPGHRAAGMRLAWLRKESEPSSAYAIALAACKCADGDKPISGDRLSLDELNILGEVYLAAKDKEHAREVATLFTDALQRYPAEPQVLLHLGQAERDAGNAKLALTHFGLALTTAQQKAAGARDAEHKARWEALAEKASRFRDELNPKH